MRAFFTFFLGWLLGWLTKWLWDFYYWRDQYKQQMAAKAGSGLEPAAASLPDVMPRQIVTDAQDDLKVIKGIGKVIERKLNDAGVYTFEQLGNLSSGDLRRILGASIQRLADEESLLRQARELSGQRS